MFKEDGIHLTRAGRCALEDDVIAGIKTVYQDVTPKTNKNLPNPNYHGMNGGHDSKDDYHGRGHGGKHDQSNYGDSQFIGQYKRDKRYKNWDRQQDKQQLY